LKTRLRNPAFFRAALLPLIFCLFLGLSRPAQAAHIGYYFGTFDPLHKGHLNLAQAAIQTLKLDSLYILPNYSPTHKPGASSFMHRYHLVQMACQRERHFKTLAPEAFSKAYQQDPQDPIRPIIAAIQAQEGAKHTFYHINGTDSFNKMVSYHKLPTLQENRIVAVFQRQGYQAQETPEVKRLKLAGKIQFFDTALEAGSSTQIRKQIQTGNLAQAEASLPDYVLHYLRRNQLYGWKEKELELETFKRQMSPGYTAQPLQPHNSSYAFEEHPLQTLIDPELLENPLSLQVDPYLAAKIPKPVYDLLLHHSVKLMIVGGLYPDTLPLLNRLGFEKLTAFSPAQERIGLYYLFGYQAGQPTLILTHLFGEDRLFHTVLEYANLFYRHLIPLDQIKVYTQDNTASLTQRLCQTALKDLEAHSQTTVLIGYHGAFQHLFSDLTLYLHHLNTATLNGLSLEELDQFIQKQNRQLLNPPQLGSPYFPYWEYRLPSGQRFISFRNTYGAASQALIQTLYQKGFRRFVVFGNAGGLSDKVKLHQIYAPTSTRFQRQTLTLNNQATSDYPAASLVKVRSVLEETQYWLQIQPPTDLVDVENFDIFAALQNKENISLYSAVLVSDLPGKQDISTKQEDSPEMIALKRQFFFRIILKSLQEISSSPKRLDAPQTQKTSALFSLPLRRDSKINQLQRKAQKHARIRLHPRKHRQLAACP